MHLEHNPFCKENYLKASLHQPPRQNDAPDIPDNNFISDNNTVTSVNIFMDDENSNALLDDNFDYSLMNLKNDFIQSSIMNVFNNQDVFDA